MVVNHNQSRFASQPTEIACASLANQQRGNGRTIAAKLSTIATISSGLVYPMDRPRPCQDEDAGHSLGRVPCSISTHWACVMLDLNSLGVCHARSQLIGRVSCSISTHWACAMLDLNSRHHHHPHPGLHLSVYRYLIYYYHTRISSTLKNMIGREVSGEPIKIQNVCMIANGSAVFFLANQKA